MSIGLLVTSYVDVRSVTINAPSDGVVVAIGTCYLEFTPLTLAASVLWVAMDEVAGGGAAARDNWSRVRLGPSAITANYSVPVTVIHMYTVSAGPVTRYLKVKRDGVTSPTVTVSQPSLVLMFMPGEL